MKTRQKIALLVLSAGLAIIELNNTSVQAQESKEPWYNCKTREVWSLEKQAWCQKVEKLKNAKYELAGFGLVQLKNGRYENRANRTTVTLVDQPGGIIFTDLNKDAQTDALAMLTVNSGASGMFTYLSATLNASNASNATSILLGDVKVQSVAVNAGKIKVNMLKYRQNEPLCCPTLPVTQTYRFRENKLVLVKESSTEVFRKQYHAINLNQMDRILVGNDPKLIALAAFGMKEKPEGNFQQSVRVHENLNSAIVTITQIGLADDSIRSRHYRVEFQRQKTNSNQPQWRLTWAGMQQICQPGRGAQTWTTKRCS